MNPFVSVAPKEAVHLRYTSHTLYEQPIDHVWVEALTKHEDPAERTDA